MEIERNEKQEALELTNNMLASASPDGVFGKAIESGGTTVITASETVTAMGIGSIGKAGGGGGTSSGRPVAVISIDAEGDVEVIPIIDPTKIALAFFTVLGSFLMMVGRIRLAGKKFK